MADTRTSRGSLIVLRAIFSALAVLLVMAWAISAFYTASFTDRCNRTIALT